MKTVKFAVVTIVLLLITSFSVTGTVMSQNKDKDPVDAKHYRMLENQYVAQVRRELEEQGYSNAGVTMTRVTDEDGERSYTVLVHHWRINTLDETQRTQLALCLAETDFPVEDCMFTYDFLE